MKSYKIAFFIGIIGIISGFMYQFHSLKETNQKILHQSIPIVCGYWSKDGTLEIVKEE